VIVILQENETQAREIVRRRRDFIRAHHPDRGGDTDLFIAGLRTFDSGSEQDAGQLPKVVIVTRRPWLMRRIVVAARRVRYGPSPPRVRLAGSRRRSATNP
jgi:DICT domain-containing protein